AELQTQRSRPQGVPSQSGEKPAMHPGDDHAGRLRCVSPRSAGAESRWLTAGGRIAVMLGLKQFRNAVTTIAGSELMQRIRKEQFGLRRFGLQGRTAPAIWNAVLRA